MIRFRKIILIVTCLFVLLCVWFFAFKDVNNRFPKQVLEEYHMGQWLDYEKIQLSPVQMDVYDVAQFKDTYPNIQEMYTKPFYKLLVMKVKIKNNGADKIDFFKYFTRYDAVAYPIGYENGGFLLDESNRYVEPGEEKEIDTCFGVSQGLVSDKNLKEFLNSQFYMGIRAYPIKQILVFDQIVIH